jgi:hypothetical protein
MQFLKMDSDRATPILYSCSIDMFCLSLTVWKLFDILILAGKSLFRAILGGFLG